MTQTTILEKFKIVFEISKSSNLFIAVIAFIILFAIVALTTNKQNAKRGKKIYGLVYATILMAILIFYYDSLGQMFDYMMNNFFIVLYFPNIAVYLAAIVITNIILLISVFNFKTSKLIKNINIIIYAIIHYLLAIVLNIITKNNLDIFSQISIYSNKEAQAMIELSGGIFILWIIFLILYKIIINYQQKDIAPVVQRKVVVKKVRILPENILEVKSPDFVKSLPQQKEEKEITQALPELIPVMNIEDKQEKEQLEQQLEEANIKLKLAEEQIKVHEETIKIKETENSKLEQEQISLQYEQTMLQQEKARLQQEKSKLLQENHKLFEEKNQQPIKEDIKIDSTTAIMKSLDSMFTLEDYKVLATILKQQQKKKKEDVTNVEQSKYTAMNEVYRSVR